jgi:hypothetical protein
MKRRIIFLLFLLGIIGSIFGIFKLISIRSPKQGVLKVTSTPEAGIFLENKHIGKTPFEDKINEGEYNIRLVPESTINSLSSWQGRIKLKHNLLTYVNADLSDSDFTTATDIIWLEKITGNTSQIAVTTNPDGASIFLDGQSKGSSPLLMSDIKPSEHSILISSPGFRTRQLKVITHEGYKLVASIKLALTSGTMENSTFATDDAKLTATSAASISATLTPSIIVNQNVNGKSSSKSADIVEPNKPYIVISETPTGFLRVRMEPYTNATESAKVNPGEKYSIIDSKNGWYQIKYDAKNIGWVSGLYVKKVE